MAVHLPRPVQARLDPAERFGLRLTLVGLAVVLVAVPFTTLLFQVLGKGPLIRFDGRVADDMNAWVAGRAGAEPLLQAISWLGRPPVLAVWVVLAAAWSWHAGRHRVAVFLVVTPLGGGVVSTLVKVAVDRPRPVVDHPVTTAFGKSFPSGHAMSSAVTYGALLVALLPVVAPHLRRVAVLLTVLLVLAIGTSRLFLGVHFVSDVLGGFVLGAAWLAGATAAFHTWRTEERRRRQRLRLALHRRGRPRPRPVDAGPTP